jgi:hypothetical protein
MAATAMKMWVRKFRAAILKEFEICTQAAEAK